MWTPIVEALPGGSESQLEADSEAIRVQRAILLCLGEIVSELQLLNARFEDAFETTIEATDL